MTAAAQCAMSGVATVLPCSRGSHVVRLSGRNGRIGTDRDLARRLSDAVGWPFSCGNWSSDR
jgi:hypothetical protein